ncbi:MAG TPA: transposase [Burkholderiales bacterium]|nr:transposase [Burkholderiales bacterium]
MGRPPRLELPDVPLHVVQRGNNRAACFFNEVDRRFYLKCLATAALARGCAIHAYVLMTNHVHLLVTPSEAGAVGAMMQDVGRRYVRVLNSIHGRTGSLWEGRFKSSLIDSESYLLTCHRYIELNPVRAGMVEHPSEYRWSSHGHYGKALTNGVITEHPEYQRLGTTADERRAAFRSLCADPLQQHAIDRIRVAINTDSALGSESFMQHAEEQLGRSVRPPTRGRPMKSVTGKLL